MVKRKKKSSKGSEQKTNDGQSDNQEKESAGEPAAPVSSKSQPLDSRPQSASNAKQNQSISDPLFEELFQSFGANQKQNKEHPSIRFRSRSPVKNTHTARRPRSRSRPTRSRPRRVAHKSNPTPVGMWATFPYVPQSQRNVRAHDDSDEYCTEIVDQLRQSTSQIVDEMRESRKVDKECTEATNKLLVDAIKEMQSEMKKTISEELPKILKK